MKYYFIFNPGSGSRKSEKLITPIREGLNQRKVNYNYGITHSLEDAYLLSKKANLSGYDVIVAVGGDGTINKVLNGFYDNQGLRISHTKMGIIYTGTSPDFCKSYGIPHDSIQKSMDVLLAGYARKIQVGKITFALKKNDTSDEVLMADDCNFATRYFSCCVNVGIGASVAKLANSGLRKVAGDFWGTLIALLKAFMIYQPLNLTVSWDGKKQKISKLYNLFVGKTFHVASGIKVKNTLTDGDGKFYVLTVRDVSWGKVPYCLKSLYGGRKISENQRIDLQYAKRIKVSGNGAASEIEFDGDPQGFLPCRIEMAEDKLELISSADE